MADYPELDAIGEAWVSAVYDAMKAADTLSKLSAFLCTNAGIPPTLPGEESGESVTDDAAEAEVVETADIEAQTG